MQKRNQTKGFVLVATKRLSFFKAGCYLAETILDHMPDAKITLFTEQQFIDDSSLQKDLLPFDKVLPTISNTNREKMYGMANTPYDITMYLDVDMEITDEDIVTIIYYSYIQVVIVGRHPHIFFFFLVCKRS